MTTLAFYDANIGLLSLSPENGIVVEKFDPGFPLVREDQHDEPNADGTYDRTQYLGERVITIEMVVTNKNGNSKDEITRALRQYLHPRQRSELQVVFAPGEPTRYIPIRTSGISQPIETWSHRRMSMSFKAPPFFLSEEISGAAEDASASVTGSLTFPFTFPFSFGGVGVSSFIQIDNIGDAPLYPRFQIVGPISSPAITNATTSEKLLFTGLDLASGDTLDIDMKRSTVVLNNNDDYASFVDYSESEWFSCDIGLNQISLEGTATTDETTLYAYWQIPYL